MTIGQYLTMIRTHWLGALVLCLAGIGAGGGYAMLEKPEYAARAQLFISTSGADADNSQLNQGGIFTQQRVKSYTEVITSPRLLGAVIQQLGLRTTADELASQITVDTPTDTVLINIRVVQPSAERARKIANTIAADFPALVDDLETPAGSTSSPVKVSVTRQASTTVDQVSPRITIDVLLGLIAGLITGLAYAVLRHTLDRTVRDPAAAGRIAGAPLIGAVIEDPGARDRPLIGDRDSGPRAEEFRRLRTNIRFLSVDHSIGSFVVTGALPQEGKTTTAANTAIALAASGQPVVLIDADLRRPSIADTFALPAAIGLTNVLLGETPVLEAIQQWRPDLPLFVLTAGPVPPNPSELLGSHQLERTVATLRARHFVVIFDSPPLLPVTDAAILARVTDGALLVTRVGKTRREQLEAAAQALRSVGAPILGVIANRIRRKKRDASYESYYGPATPAAPVTGRAGMQAQARR